MAKLKKAESVQKFAKRIKWISQEDLQRIGLSSLHSLLVKKGIVTTLEIQQAFLDEAELQGHLLVDKV